MFFKKEALELENPLNKHPFRHGKLSGRFHPDFPDDVQVIVHEGGPYFSDREPELMWVRVTGCENDIFSGVVLNTPHQLREVRKGSVITFLVPEKGEYPLLVSTKYVQERPTWRLLMPCENCGLSELFDPPSDLLAKTFSSVMPEQVSRGFTFTTRCGFCRGAVVVRIKRSV